MAPGLFVEAYVPTPQELSGNFSAFGVTLLDPLSRAFDSSGQFWYASIPRQSDPSRSPFTACLPGVSLPHQCFPLRCPSPLFSPWVAPTFLLHLRVDPGEPGNCRSPPGVQLHCDLWRRERQSDRHTTRRSAADSARRYCLFKVSWTPYPDIRRQWRNSYR